MEHVSIDKEALREYQMREMALSDWTSGLNHAREKGIQQGIQQGMQQGMRQGIQQGMQQGMQQGIQQGMQQGMRKKGQEIIFRMRERGVPLDQIVEYTGLSAEEIKRIEE